jgi:hypothetical protein
MSRPNRSASRCCCDSELCGCMQGAAIFEDKLFSLYLSTYQDQVNAVRMSATRSLQPLARTLGGAWVVGKLLPKLSDMYSTDGSSYLQRITVLYGLRELSVHKDLADIAGHVLPIVLRGLSDAVPNVRFVAAQILQQGLDAGVYDKARISADIKPALEMLKSDTDSDVKHFAGVAMQHC